MERGSVDLAAAAQTKAFAKMMRGYASNELSKAAPLITAEGIPYLYYAFEQIESDHGSVLAYLEKELDVGPQEIARLRAQYLEWVDCSPPRSGRRRSLVVGKVAPCLLSDL